MKYIACLEGMPGSGKSTMLEKIKIQFESLVIKERYVNLPKINAFFAFIGCLFYVLIEIFVHFRARQTKMKSVWYDRSYISIIAYSYACTRTRNGYYKQFHIFLSFIISTLIYINLLPKFDVLFVLDCTTKTSIDRRIKFYSRKYSLWYDYSFLESLKCFYDSLNARKYCLKFVNVSSNSISVDEMIQLLIQETIAYEAN